MGIIPSASYSITVRLEVPGEGLPPSQLTSAVESAGGMVTAFDVNAARGDRLQRVPDQAGAPRLKRKLSEIAEGQAVIEQGLQAFRAQAGAAQR